MKFLNKEKISEKSFLYFLMFLFLLQPGLSIAVGDNGETQTLDRKAQEFICITNTSSLQAEEICIKDQVDVERVAVCNLYTETYVSEALCLKTKLSSENILKCYIDTDELIEQICIIGTETSSRIIDDFETSNQDFSNIITEIGNIKAEMENLLGGYKVKLNLPEGRFEFHDN